MFKGRSSTFSFTTFDDEWIFLLLETNLINIVIVDLTCIDMVQ
jgi:hypothetical protein